MVLPRPGERVSIFWLACRQCLSGARWELLPFVRSTRNRRRFRYSGRPLVGINLRQRVDDRLHQWSPRSAQYPDDRLAAGYGLPCKLLGGGPLHSARSPGRRTDRWRFDGNEYGLIRDWAV